ncbi:MAG: dephospho-CoA kinase [Candidatus Ornithomonoglobus sp.]
MYIFGITGPTGAGKSTVSDYFRDLGVYVADADKAARAVVGKGTPCLDELKKAFGRGIINSDGELNRRRLGEIVFADENKLLLLNTITHKYIKKYLERELDASGAAIGAIDGAVIIGSPVQSMCRRLAVVTADRGIRADRITARDGLSRESAEKRIDAQMSDAEYISHADYIIKNNKNDELGEQIEHIYNEIKAAAEKESAP